MNFGRYQIKLDKDHERKTKAPDENKKQVKAENYSWKWLRA